jgi:thiamine kinase-like enzyme
LAQFDARERLVLEAAAVQHALQSIPGWEQANWSPLPGGLTNEGLLLESNGRKAVLKIDTAPRSLPLNSRIDEARIQSVANAAGVAAPVLFVTETLILTKFLEGDVCRQSSFMDESILRQLALAMRRTHSLPLTGRTFDAHRSAEIYMRRLAGRSVDSKQAERHLARILKMRAPGNLCCCHNDLVAENIVVAESVHFLDWEYACDNDPFFDLATAIAHNKLSLAQADFLLNEYFSGDAARWLPQLEKQVRLYESLAWLWEASRS